MYVRFSEFHSSCFLGLLRCSSFLVVVSIATVLSQANRTATEFLFAT